MPRKKVVAEMTADEYQSHRDNDDGICLACGETTVGGVEPDADGYPCEACGEPLVCGVEEALLAEKIAIVEG